MMKVTKFKVLLNINSAYDNLLKRNVNLAAQCILKSGGK